MAVTLASCIPRASGPRARTRPAGTGPREAQPASLAGTQPSSPIGPLSAVSDFDSSPNLFVKKKCSGQVAKKSSFRTGAPNSLTAAEPGLGESQSYFHSPAFPPELSTSPQLLQPCTWPGPKGRCPAEPSSSPCKAQSGGAGSHRPLSAGGHMPAVSHQCNAQKSDGVPQSALTTVVL